MDHGVKFAERRYTNGSRKRRTPFFDKNVRKANPIQKIITTASVVVCTGPRGANYRLPPKGH